MIIEGAFFKIPEILIESRAPGDQYEGTLVSQLAMAVLLELNARNIQQPLHRVHIERPYPTPPDQRHPGRADLYVNLDEIYPTSLDNPFAEYGIKPHNWLEAKLFARIGERAGSETKTSNAGDIALDLIRLCLFVPESTWGIGLNARYFLVVSDRNPSEYVALSRRSPNPPRRKWLEALISPGVSDLTIALSEEPRSFQSAIRSEVDTFLTDLVVQLRTSCIQFAPITASASNSYFGSLVRILGFRVSSQDIVLSYDELNDPLWDEEKTKAQSTLSARLRGVA